MLRISRFHGNDVQERALYFNLLIKQAPEPAQLKIIYKPYVLARPARLPARRQAGIGHRIIESYEVADDKIAILNDVRYPNWLY